MDFVANTFFNPCIRLVCNHLHFHPLHLLLNENSNNKNISLKNEMSTSRRKFWTAKVQCPLGTLDTLCHLNNFDRPGYLTDDSEK